MRNLSEVHKKIEIYIGGYTNVVVNNRPSRYLSEESFDSVFFLAIDRGIKIALVLVLVQTVDKKELFSSLIRVVSSNTVFVCCRGTVLIL